MLPHIYEENTCAYDAGDTSPPYAVGGGGDLPNSPPSSSSKYLIRALAYLRSPSQRESPNQREPSSPARSGASKAPSGSPIRPVWGGGTGNASGSPTKGVPVKNLEDDESVGPRKTVKRALEKLHEDPPPKTNTLQQMRQFVAATDEKWLRARKAQHWHFKGTAEDDKYHREQMTTFRQRRGIDDRKVAAVCGGNKTARETLWEHGCQECPEADLDSQNFDIRWTINHNDINFAELRPTQMCNHFPNSGIEIGSKVGLARNLKSLQWFDNIDMNTFFPRMYNLANPWEMQDFVEDFVFTAGHVEVMRFTSGMCVTSAQEAAERESPKGSKAARGGAGAINIKDAAKDGEAGEGREGERGKEGKEGQESKIEGWRGGAYSWAQSISVLEAAYDICESFLDNRARLKQIPSDPRAVPQGVLNLADYWQVRPDVGALQELPAAESLAASACGGRRKRWQHFSEEEIGGKLAAMAARLEHEHVQLKLDGLRNIWIVKPGHGSRGRGIKVFDDLQAIISFATSRKKSAIAQKYIENCLTLDKKKFDIRFWVLVTNWNPLTLWSYEPYFRLCTEDHSLDQKSLSNQFQHLCNRCVQEHHEEYEDEDAEGGMMWSVNTFIEHMNSKGEDGEQLYNHIRAQCQQVAQYSMHSCQEMIDNKAGCFEWFGLDFMVDEEYKVWNLECNISPDLSKGTDVLERLVPNAFNKVWDMLLSRPPKEETRTRDDCWDLIFHGKEIKKDVIQKRYWLKKNLLTELRAGRPYSMRDALIAKLGVYTNTYLSSRDKNKNDRDKARVGGGKSGAPKGAKKGGSKRESDDDDDDDDDDDAAE